MKSVKWFQGRIWKCEKLTDDAAAATDDRRKVKTKAHMALWAKWATNKCTRKYFCSAVGYKQVSGHVEDKKQPDCVTYWIFFCHKLTRGSACVAHFA